MSPCKAPFCERREKLFPNSHIILKGYNLQQAIFRRPVAISGMIECVKGSTHASATIAIDVKSSLTSLTNMRVWIPLETNWTALRQEVDLSGEHLNGKLHENGAGRFLQIHTLPLLPTVVGIHGVLASPPFHRAVQSPKRRVRKFHESLGAPGVVQEPDLPQRSAPARSL